MFFSKGEHPLSHNQILLPAAELHVGAEDAIVATNNRRIEWRDKRGMEKIQQVGGGRADAFDM